MVWLTLVSGGASAQILDSAEHEAWSGQAHAAHGVQALTIDAQTRDSADAGHVDACNQAHCGHCHTNCMFTPRDAFVGADSLAGIPSHSPYWVSHAISDNIDRPKWLSSSPIVVSLLS